MIPPPTHTHNPTTPHTRKSCQSLSVACFCGIQTHNSQLVSGGMSFWRAAGAQKVTQLCFLCRTLVRSLPWGGSG